MRSYPGRSFAGKVALIYPHLSPATRTVKVRIELPNPDHLLLPDMYAEAEIDTGSGQQVVAVPESAVIDSGERQVVIVEKGDKTDEEQLLNVALEAGADDMSDDGGAFEIICSPESFEGVRDAVKALGLEPASAEVAMIPQNYIKLQGKDAQVMLKLMEALDDHDDVQGVSANFNIPEETMAEIGSGG